LELKRSGSCVDPGAIHVQNSVLHTSTEVLLLTQVRVMSLLYVGQQVTVVTDAMPVESWQALM
jgi:hypothetical protein